MFIPDPDFYPSRIPNLVSRTQKQQQKKGVKKFLSYIFYSHKFHKIENYFIFEKLKKKIGVSFQRIIELVTQKFVTKLSKDGFGIRNPGSENRDPENIFRMADPGFQILVQGSKRHRIPDPDPQHWKRAESFSCSLDVL
jgi:hypothetical protein